MTYSLKRGALLLSAVAVALLSGCVSQGTYDALEAQNKTLQQQNATMAADVSAKSQQITSDKAQISRLQEAIKYTVNSDLLFPSGSWNMSPQGEKIIAKMALKLAPMQESKLMVNGYTDNQPVGKRLERQGVTTNEILSQKRAEAVMQYLISQGAKPDLIGAQGFGEADPIASNDTPKGRSENRRVELTIAQAGS